MRFMAEKKSTKRSNFIFQRQGYERGSLLAEVPHDEAKMRGRRESTKGVPLLSKMVYKRAGPLRIKFC